MRLVFAGTPDFAARALARLLETRHEVALVLTQPDRPAGRGLQTVPSEVKRLARGQGLALFQPESLRSTDAIDRLRDARPDALVVAAYGLILPAAALEVAAMGALNIHASLLPRWRGAAPIQRALLAGDRETGISIMRMDTGLDTGPILLQRPVTIADDEDAGTLHDKLALLGAEAIVAALAALESGGIDLVPQPAEGATYARKIDKRELRLDWSRPAIELERKVRAFRPVPGASADVAGHTLKIWRARVVDGCGAPGRLLEGTSSLVVACGEQALEIQELQRPGGRAMQAAEFLRGRRFASGNHSA